MGKMAGRSAHPPPKSLEEGASDNISSNPPTSLPQCPENASWKTDQCPHVCSPGTFLKGERIPVWGIFKVFVLDVFPQPSFQDEAEAGWVLELAENRGDWIQWLLKGLVSRGAQKMKKKTKTETKEARDTGGSEWQKPGVELRADLKVHAKIFKWSRNPKPSNSLTCVLSKYLWASYHLPGIMLHPSFSKFALYSGRETHK